MSDRSNRNKNLGEDARDDLADASKSAKKAADKFKSIGDPDGKKLADDAADAADKGLSYITKRIGKRSS